MTVACPRCLAIAPETWRSDLLRIVLCSCAVFGGVVYVPSLVSALKLGATSLAIIETSAIAAILTLARFDRIPNVLRAVFISLLFYAIGIWLLISVGAISQVYLLMFSLFATLLLNARWGLATVALNAVTMFALGFLGLVALRTPVSHFGWMVVTVNFAFLDVSLVLTISAVITALETALGTALTAHVALEQEQKALVFLNHSLEQEVRDRAHSEQSLRENKALLRIAGRTARLGGWRVENGSDHMTWSDEACDIHGVPTETSPTIDEALMFYSPPFRGVIKDALALCGRDGTAFDEEAEIATAKGTRLWVRVIGHALRNDASAITHIHGSVQDITPQKVSDARHEKLEEQYRQTQKMETIGSLAGGVAHDFNNLMSIVLSYSQMLAEDLSENDPMRADLDEIHKAGRRATDLTRQLLAFSRQQVLEPKIIDLSEVVGGMENMLRRLIGEDVELNASCARGLGKVLVDPGQMEQVIMNLAVNARDAMPSGGKLTIETAAVTLGERYASEHVGVAAGPHVMLAVSDTGTGMSKETRARMFEPFFTTKDKGKGTGLGLATVFGIVQQSGGTIWVYSEAGKGTTFKVYFPLAAQTTLPARNSAPFRERRSARGSETILLVEDEERIRVLTRTILRKQGYNVLEAQNGGDALLLCEQHAATIHLLLTDVVMPRMSGRQLAERLLPLRPYMKVLYMSGYTDDAVVRHGILDSTIAFIQKPLTPEPLARKVREVLDGYTLTA
ncbi:MAG: ATP-binding protein [bacterium]